AAPPVTFRAVASGTRWKGIHIGSESDENIIAGALITDGGSAAWTGDGDSRAMVYVTGRLHLAGSTLQSSAHYALYLTGSASLDRSILAIEGNVFRSNARAVRTHPRWAMTAGRNIFESNADNRIWVGFSNNDRMDMRSEWFA